MLTNRSNLKSLALIAGSILLGVLIAYLAIPFLFKTLPSDFKRTGLILRTLNENNLHPEVVLFGNSILMNGVDAKQVAQRLNGKEVFNLSSTGQTLSEGYLYYQDIPPSVHTVVQFLSVDDLSSDDQFSQKTLTNFLLMGYKPSDSTVSALKAALGEKSVSPFYRNSFENRFEGRWIIVNYINSAVRQSLRKDLALDHLETELYYPYTYNQKVEPKKMELLLEKNNPEKPLNDFVIDQHKAWLLKTARNYFAARGVNYIVCVFPVHPRLVNYTPAYFESMRKVLDQNRSDLPVIDFTHLLSEDQFVDHCHPDKAGAMIMSEKLAGVLQENYK